LIVDHAGDPISDVLLGDRVDRDVGEVGEQAFAAVRRKVLERTRGQIRLLLD